SLEQDEFINLAQTMKVITASWVAETSGAFTAADITGCQGMWLVMVETNPGTRAPTDDYDITLTDTGGRDVAAGILADRDTATTEVALPDRVSRPVDSDLTLNITNNVVDRANGTVKLFLSSVPTAIAAAAA
ncbi:unnamed protein product, partial [marine sediment metagenome]